MLGTKNNVLCNFSVSVRLATDQNSPYVLCSCLDYKAYKLNSFENISYFDRKLLLWILWLCRSPCDYLKHSTTFEKTKLPQNA
jgi:hypothetical protein